jgi:hypothetical protein
MLLNVSGYELEIVQGKFVCLGQNYGETSHFSEWTYLDPLPSRLLQIGGTAKKVSSASDPQGQGTPRSRDGTRWCQSGNS